MADVKVVPAYGGHVVHCADHGLMTSGSPGFIIVWTDPLWAAWGVLGHVAVAHLRTASSNLSP